MMWRRISQGLGIVLIVGLALSQSGCALALVPGLAGIGGAGYLWGKEAARHDATKDGSPAQPQPAERGAAR
jgi:hypothetical protein